MNHADAWGAVFRAGGETSGLPSLAGRQSLLLADVSEFQADVNDPVYLKWSKAIVIRALYGAGHVDSAWFGGARRDALHAGGARFIGIYQFLAPGQDAAGQARALVDLLGPLRQGELPVCDLEVADDGNQLDRWKAWAAVIKKAYGIDPWLYSGLFFARQHSLSPHWVAAYQPSEPATPHLMWQFTDRYPVPGVGTADCSVFRGLIGDLAAAAYQAPAPKPAPRPAPAKPAATEEDDMPAGVIRTAQGVRESNTWPQGAAGEIVLYSDWAGVQDAAPVVDVRVASLAGDVAEAGQVTVDGTAHVQVARPADCNGAAFTRVDAGAATVSWHVNPPKAA